MKRPDANFIGFFSFQHVRCSLFHSLFRSISESHGSYSCRLTEKELVVSHCRIFKSETRKKTVTYYKCIMCLLIFEFCNMSIVKEI